MSSSLSWVIVASSRFCVVVALLLFVVVSCRPDDDEQRIGGCSSFGYDVAPGLCFVGASRCLVVVNRGRRPESRRRRGSSGMQHGDVVDDNG
jgi:hypothetical protein